MQVFPKLREHYHISSSQQTHFIKYVLYYLCVIDGKAEA